MWDGDDGRLTYLPVQHCVVVNSPAQPCGSGPWGLVHGGAGWSWGPRSHPSWLCRRGALAWCSRWLIEGVPPC